MDGAVAVARHTEAAHGSQLGGRHARQRGGGRPRVVAVRGRRQDRQAGAGRACCRVFRLPVPPVVTTTTATGAAVVTVTVTVTVAAVAITALDDAEAMQRGGTQHELHDRRAGVARRQAGLLQTRLYLLLWRTWHARHHQQQVILHHAHKRPVPGGGFEHG